MTTRQVIYEQGGGSRGACLHLEGGNLYFVAWNYNNDGTNSAWGETSVAIPVTANTDYYGVFRLDGNADVMNGALNGGTQQQTTGVGYLYSHSGAVSIGGISSTTVFYDGSKSTSGIYFGGTVYEMLFYNAYVDDTEKTEIQNYFAFKYGL